MQERLPSPARSFLEYVAFGSDLSACSKPDTASSYLPLKRACSSFWLLGSMAYGNRKMKEEKKVG
jgi:hypothetical protein